MGRISRYFWIVIFMTSSVWASWDRCPQKLAQLKLRFLQPSSVQKSSIEEFFPFDDDDFISLTDQVSLQITPLTECQFEVLFWMTPEASRLHSVSWMNHGPHYPRTQISWDMAQILMKQLNRLQNKYHYRLPTGAEWWSALRWSDGDSSTLLQYAWLIENSRVGLSLYPQMHFVGEKAPSRQGFYDLIGNVMQWLMNVHDFSLTVPKDPSIAHSLSFGDPYSDANLFGYSKNLDRRKLAGCSFADSYEMCHKYLQKIYYDPSSKTLKIDRTVGRFLGHADKSIRSERIGVRLVRELIPQPLPAKPAVLAQP